jgi:hypothetical protein
MSSSELDEFLLNTDRLVRLPALVLNSGTLDGSTFVGSSYNANDLTYDNFNSTYNGALTQFSKANTSLSSLTSNANTTPQVIVTAESQFGTINATANATVSNLVSASAPLGALSANASSSVTNTVSANANLGNLDSTITATIVHVASGSSELGSLVSTANTLPTILPIFDAPLGGLTAQVNSEVTDLATATAEFGLLNASAISTVIPKPQPQPEQQYGANRPYASPQPPKKPESIPEPPKVEIKETPKAQPVRMPATIVAKAGFNTIKPKFEAQAEIEWSILDDEADLLLLI